MRAAASIDEPAEDGSRFVELPSHVAILGALAAEDECDARLAGEARRNRRQSQLLAQFIAGRGDDRNAVGQVFRLEVPPSDAGGASPSESAIASRTSRRGKHAPPKTRRFCEL